MFGVFPRGGANPTQFAIVDNTLHMHDLAGHVRCVVAEVHLSVNGSVRQDDLSSDSDKLLGHVCRATDPGRMITHFPDDLGEEQYQFTLLIDYYIE